jgi:metal-responsive CopG/Arc/MetJ family transcriptional regulator
MADVMISLPDELLERIDAYASRRGTTRNDVMRELVERELERDAAEPESASDAAARRARIRELLADPGHHGGDSVRLIRKHRDAR